MPATPSASKLFEPLKLGKLTLSNRLVLAPLTRFRAEDNHVPMVPLVPKYYAQRGAVPGTLLVTEATFISPAASGYPNAPGLWSPEQVAGWKAVTDAVHAKGSYIFAQLWALGRTASADFKKAEGTGDVVSSSDVPMAEGATVPRPLSEDEIAQYVADYAQAARNAIEAGFDGVEIHGANGYLVDQFLQDVVNKRTDKYGGSIENRARFALEVTRAVVDAVGAERTAIRLSPWGTFQGMGMKEPLPTFSYVLEQLAALKVAYVHLVEARVDGSTTLEKPTDVSDPLVEVWHKAAPATSPILLAGGFSPEIARATVDEEHAHANVAVVFGRHWISTPDLVYRIQHGLELNPYDRDTFYTPKAEKGYTDYAFSPEFLKENPTAAA